MKKIIISVAVLFGMLIASPLLAHAAGSFNTDAGDMPTVTVSNGNTNPCQTGPIDGCWKTSVSARPGDLITVHIYFHNSTDTVAENTMLSLSPRTTASGTTHTFSGSVSSTTIGSANGSATVTTSSNQTITFIPGSVRVGDHAGNFYSVTDENSLFGSGVSIDEVSPGWDKQGFLVAQFRVSNNPDNGGNCYINSFTSDDYSVSSGQSTRLHWNTSGCDYVNISNVGSNLSTSGSTTVNPYSDTTYTITAYPGGNSQSLTIRVTNNSNNCYVNIYADRTNINQGDSVTLRWQSSGSVYNVDIYPGYPNQGTNGTISVNPYLTTNYTATARGSNCTNSDSVTVYVAGINSNARPQAITNPATLVTASSAKLNGIAIANGNTNTTAWFEWGTTANLGAATQIQNIGSAGSLAYSYVLSGLYPNTTYYFRAVAQNQSGIASGETLSFRTGAGVYVPPPVTTTRTRVVTKTQVVNVGKSAPSLLEMRVESLNDHMCVGGEIEYTISYKNISNSTLTDAVLQVTHPKQLEFIDASKGDYSASERKLTFGIGTLSPGEEGSITVRGRVTTDASIGDLIVTTATVVYTNPATHAQEDAIAYSLTTISKDCPNGLGANALFGDSFLPHTLLEWLLLILIILALILVGRKLYEKKPAA